MPDESSVGSTKKLDLRTIAVTLGMAVMLGGLVGQWFTQKAAVSEVQKDVSQVEQGLTTYKEKTDKRILDVKIELTSSTSDVSSIKEDISEIKDDVKKLLSRPR